MPPIKFATFVYKTQMPEERLHPMKGEKIKAPGGIVRGNSAVWVEILFTTLPHEYPQQERNFLIFNISLFASK